jgi:hypothetical protein
MVDSDDDDQPDGSSVPMVPPLVASATQPV